MLLIDRIVCSSMMPLQSIGWFWVNLLQGDNPANVEADWFWDLSNGIEIPCKLSWGPFLAFEENNIISVDVMETDWLTGQPNDRENGETGQENHACLHSYGLIDVPQNHEDCIPLCQFQLGSILNWKLAIV